MTDRLVYLRDSRSLLEVPEAVELLRRHGLRPVVAVPPGASGDVVAVVVGLGRFGAADVEALPGVRTVARFGAGYDNVDVNGLWASRRIAVSYTPDISTGEVAEMTLAMMILTLRGIPRDLRGLASEPTKWRVIRRGISLSDATVGLVGAGHIGLAVARLVAPLAAKVLLWTRSRRVVVLPGVAANRYEQVGDFDELAARADVVSVHLPLTPETTGIIGAAFFERLRAAGRSIALVNTARGNVVDERALLDALDDNTVRAAAIDVWSHEGPVAAARLGVRERDDADVVALLRRHPAVLPTSHIGAFTSGVLYRCAMRCAQNIVAVIEDKQADAAGCIAAPAA